MYTIQHNLQDFTIVPKPASLLYSTNTWKYLDWKANVRYLLLNLQNGDLLWQSSTYESKRTLHFSVTCISKKIYETRTDAWHTAQINPYVPFLQLVESEIFTRFSLHFIKHTKPTNKDPVILVPNGHSSHTRKLEVINLGREYHVGPICFQIHNSQKMQRLDKAFMKHLKTFYCQEIEI